MSKSKGAVTRSRDAPGVVSADDAEAANAGRGAEPSSSGKDSASRVIYIGQLPHGFYEDQLKGTGLCSGIEFVRTWYCDLYHMICKLPN